MSDMKYTFVIDGEEWSNLVHRICGYEEQGNPYGWRKNSVKPIESRLHKFFTKN